MGCKEGEVLTLKKVITQKQHTLFVSFSLMTNFFVASDFADLELSNLTLLTSIESEMQDEDQLQNDKEDGLHFRRRYFFLVETQRLRFQCWNIMCSL